MHKQRASNTLDVINFTLIIVGPFHGQFSKSRSVLRLRVPAKHFGSLMACALLSSASIVSLHPFIDLNTLYLYFETLLYLRPKPLSLLKILLPLVGRNEISCLCTIESSKWWG